MRGRVIAGFVVPIVLVAGASGYAWADAADLVPGILTDDPLPVSPAPFVSFEPVGAGDGPAFPASALAADAPLPSADTIQSLAQQLRDDPRTGNSTNVAVMDLVTGEYLASVSAAEPQVPASTAKLLTTLAAVAALGSEFTTHTDALWDSARGEVALIAGGDIMLAADSGHGGDDVRGVPIDDANGWAGLGDLADQAVERLTAAGVTSLRVVYDDSAFPGPAVPLEWPAYALNLGYAAPVTGLAVDIAKKGPGEYAARWPNPSSNAAEVFADRLRERGLTVTLGASRSGATGDVIGSVRSAPLRLVVEHTLHESDNTTAEMIGRVLARETGRPATPSGAASAVVAALSDLGLDTGTLELYDGAGFSVRDRISPAHLIEAMQLSLHNANTKDFLEWLPIAGMEGTVNTRFISTPAAGLLRAKTGSLTGVTSLAGVVQTADGRVLLFAVLADGMRAGQEGPRQAVDDFVLALAQCGCS